VALIALWSLGCLAVYSPTGPAPGALWTRTEARGMDCERLSVEAGHERYPGRIRAPAPRGDYVERGAVVCQERLFREGLRPPQDEAILSSLEARVAALARAAGALRPDLAGRTWLVEVHYPSAPVSSKIDFAAKNALMLEGLAVSDRAPRLAVGDVRVLTPMPPERAYPAACRRWADNGSLGGGDALLAVLLRDPRETALHAGICDGGQWTWVL